MDLGAVVSRSEPLQSYQLGNAHSNTSITSTAPGHFMNPEWKAAAALVRGPQSQPPFPSNSPQPSTSVLPSLHPHSPLHITSHHHQPETQTQAAVSSATSTNPEPSANAEPPAEEELKAIESRRKESHKEVEKRRRNQINQGIQRLLTMLPPLPFPSPSQESPNSAPSQPSSAAQNGAYSASVPSSGNLTSHAKQANKAIILDSAANYIQHLKEVEQSNIDKWTLEKLLADQATAELRQERDFYKSRMEHFEMLLHERGIRPVDAPHPPPNYHHQQHQQQHQGPHPQDFTDSMNQFGKRPRV